MMKIVLPKLLEKKGGVIVNLSFSAAKLNPPMFSVYYATRTGDHFNFKLVTTAVVIIGTPSTFYGHLKCPPSNLTFFVFP